MKIKHWQGYGCVNAKKISKRTFTDMWGEKRTELKIRVEGNHEWGLERRDIYDLYNWLVKRFDKTVSNYYNIEYTCNDYYIKDKSGLDIEVCDYTFTY